MQFPRKQQNVVLVILLLLIFQSHGAWSLQHTSNTKVINDSWFGKDKLYHWGISYIATLILYNGYRTIIKSDADEAYILSAGWTFSLGLAKEDFDKQERKKYFSKKDLFADGLGIAAGLLTAALIQK